MKFYEIPIVVTIRADTREEAEERAIDVADSLDYFYQGVQGDAITTIDHNLLDRLWIDPNGNDV